MQLRVLQAVARTGSVTRAAEELAVTQPAVSHAIGNLERELGAELLVRRNDGVSLTATGRAVIRRADVILVQLEGIHQEVEAASGVTGGRLRVGVIPSINARLMPRILRAFGAAHDRVRLIVLEGSDTEVLEWLRTCAVDVATVTAPAPDLATTPLARDRMLAVLPAGHPLSARSAVTLADLQRDPFIMSTGGCEPLIIALARRAGVRLRSHYRVRDTGSILAMVAEHLGVTVMPDLALPASVPGTCVIPLRPAEHRTVQLAVSADTPALPAATAFVEVARRVAAAAG